MKKSKNSLDSSEIKRLYRAEKARIEDSAQQLEREKCKAYLRLMDKRAQLVRDKISNRMNALRRSQARLQQIKRKHDNLLQEIGKVISENDGDLKILKNMGSERKKLLSEIKQLSKKHKRKK